MSTDNFTIEDLNSSTTRVWSLVDSPTKKIAPANSVTRKYPTKIFFIAALSPDEARYHELQKRPVATWWMSAWADNEILSLYVYCFLDCDSLTDSLFQPEWTRLSTILHSDQFKTLPAIQTLEKAGPCPSDISFIRDPEGFQNRVILNLKAQSFSKLVALLRSPSESESESVSRDIPHSFMLVQRLGLSWKPHIWMISLTPSSRHGK